MTALITLAALACGSSFITLIALGRGLIRPNTANALFAASNLLAAVIYMVAGSRGWAAAYTGVSAWCAYQWWRDGGGDGTRRRLKSWAARFRGVRRTAPQGA